MATTAVEGVVAAGRVPTWVIPAALVTQDPSEGSWSIDLDVLLHETTVKIDCHYDYGDVTVTRTPSTRSRQRACQIVAQTINVGETIDVTIAAVFDQQEDMSDVVNEAYSAMPQGADVYIAQAFGWDSSVEPTTATVIDLFPGTVQTRTKNQPTTPEEDLKFTAVVSASAYFEDVALDGGSV